jgi:hypothetical protein
MVDGHPAGPAAGGSVSPLPPLRGVVDLLGDAAGPAPRRSSWLCCRRAGARCRETETGDHLVVEPGLGWGRLASGPTLNVPLNCGFEGSSGLVLMASASPSFGRCRVAAGARGSGDGAGCAGRGGAGGGGRFAVIRGVPGSARPACWPRCARLPARRGCGWPPAAASSRASWRTGSCVSGSSRCSRPLLRISARSCCRGLPH